MKGVKLELFLELNHLNTLSLNNWYILLLIALQGKVLLQPGPFLPIQGFLPFFLPKIQGLFKNFPYPSLKF